MQPGIVATQKVHLHCYFDHITENYTANEFFEYLSGPHWDGIEFDFLTSLAGGVVDFKQSLGEPGAVVIYLGHSVLDYELNYSEGLAPRGGWYAAMGDMDGWYNRDKDKHDRKTGGKPLPPQDLMSWLKTSPARVVIFASCASATLPWGLSLANFPSMGVATWKKKVPGAQPAVIVTYNPSQLLTSSDAWAYALAAFLFDLIDYDVELTEDGWLKKPESRNLMYHRDQHGTIRQALDAANAMFKKKAMFDKNNTAPDIFVQVNGTGSTVVFPDRPLGFVTEDLVPDFGDDIF
jgi:hypothetical protein